MEQLPLERKGNVLCHMAGTCWMKRPKHNIPSLILLYTPYFFATLFFLAIFSENHNSVEHVCNIFYIFLLFFF